MLMVDNFHIRGINIKSKYIIFTLQLVEIIELILFYGGLVQWLEHEAYTFGVGGSNPSSTTQLVVVFVKKVKNCLLKS